jgi:peptidyl-prolyl cis-trans isomerase C
MSPPIVSGSGVHVILLLEKIPGNIMPAEERRALFREEVAAGRAQAAQRKLLETLRASAGVDRSVDGLLAQVAVEP